MSDNIVSGNKFAFGEPLSASVGVNFNLTVAMPDAYSLTGKWATLTVSKFEDGPELFKLSEAGGGLTFNGQNIPVVINNDATNETAGGDDWHTLIQTYRNLRFSLDVGDDSDTSHAEYRFQGDITTDPQRGTLSDGLEVGETVTPTLGGTTVSVSLLGQQAGGGANDGDDTDITGLLYGDGASLSAATASQARQAAELDATDSPTFDDLTLTGDINLPSSNVFSVNGAGRVQLTDMGGTMVEFSNAYFTGFNGGIRLGATAGGITTDVQIARNSATEIRFVQSDGTTRCDLLADNLTLDGDINLSDGAQVVVGGGSGTLTVDGDLTMTDGNTLKVNTITTLDDSSKFSSQIKTYTFLQGNLNWRVKDDVRIKRGKVEGFGASVNVTPDIAWSSDAAGVMQLGNGTNGDTSGTLELANIIASGDINLSDGSQVVSSGDLIIGYDAGTILFSESRGAHTANISGPINIQKSGTTQFTFGGASGNYTHRNLYTASTSFTLGLSSKRWGTAYLTDIDASGDIDFTGLPTSDPASAGRLWNDSGTLKISAG